MANSKNKKGGRKEGANGYAFYRKQEDMEVMDAILKSGIKPQKHEEYRPPYFIRTPKTIQITLGWGGVRGEKDGYKLYFDDSGKLARGVYWWADGSVHEEVALTPKEVKKMAGYYGVLPS